MEHLAKLNAAARLSDLPPPRLASQVNVKMGFCILKVYVVHVSVLKEAVVVRHFFALVGNLP